MKNTRSNLHPAWISGFIDGEGSFWIGLIKSNTMLLGIQIQLQFAITQHIRDKELMGKIKDFMGCGYIAKDGFSKLQYRIRSVNDLENYLFPLLDLYPLQTQKSLDAAAFRKVHTMVKNKAHLTLEGLEEIKEIKSTMNRARMIQYK